MPYPAKTNPETILETALEMLESEGETALSMRSLADKLGLNAPSLYRHYADKEALEIAIVTYGNTLMQTELEQATDRKTPALAVQAASSAYLEFARTHPRLYVLMMDTRLAAPTAGTAKALWNTVLKVIGGITSDPDDTPAAVALWAFLHGFAELERAGLFGPSGPKGGFEVGLNAIIEGLPRAEKTPAEARKKSRTSSRRSRDT